MAIAPPDTAVRIVLASEGNETEGDLKEAARTAAANRIPIDVLPLRYRYDNEVLFRRIAAPPRVRSGQTIPLRFLLDSTGRRPRQADADVERQARRSDARYAGSRGPRRAQGRDQRQDGLDPGGRPRNLTTSRRSSWRTIRGRTGSPRTTGPARSPTWPGRATSASSTSTTPARDLARVLQEAGINTVRSDVSELPTELPRLLDVDAIVLVNTPVHHFTMAQQEMLCRYVNDLGGGLVMVGGPDAFGAGGWIGSPVAGDSACRSGPAAEEATAARGPGAGARPQRLDDRREGRDLQGGRGGGGPAARAGATRWASWSSTPSATGSCRWVRPRTRRGSATGSAASAPAAGRSWDRPWRWRSTALKGAKTSVKHVILLTDGQTVGPGCLRQAGDGHGRRGHHDLHRRRRSRRRHRTAARHRRAGPGPVLSGRRPDEHPGDLHQGGPGRPALDDHRADVLAADRLLAQRDSQRRAGRAAGPRRLRADGSQGRPEPVGSRQQRGRSDPGDLPVRPGPMRRVHQLGRQPLGGASGCSGPTSRSSGSR